MKSVDYFRRLRNNEDTTLCRQCINRLCNLNLKSNDCYYHYYVSKCAECGEVKHIVTGVGVLKRWKLWGKKPTK